MASEDARNKSAGKTSVTVWFAVMIALTLVAAAGGGGFGLYLTSQAKLILGKDGKQAKETAEVAGPPHISNADVRDLPPIITNLSQPSDTWVRLHAAIVFDPTSVEKPEIMAAEISNDILGFMQTLSLAQLSGASGLQHLREDLNDRAVVRSAGRVHELVIESVVVQ